MNSWAMAPHRLPLRVPRPRASTGYGSVMSLEPPRLETFGRLSADVRIPRHMKSPGPYRSAGALALINETLATIDPV